MKNMIMANWKMQLSIKDGLVLAKQIAKQIKNSKSEVVICPDYASLPFIGPVLKKSFVALGAQDSAVTEYGAYTGEVSPVNLKSLGVSYVIIGHSERREHLHENSAIINAKIKAALGQKLIPILCIGEKLTERNNGETKKYLSSELRRALKGVKISNSNSLIIAYEPIWAISTNRSAKPILAEEADEVQSFIKQRAFKILKKTVRILYGGSVNIRNAEGFLAQQNINGLLIGAASLNFKDFSFICSI